MKRKNKLIKAIILAGGSSRRIKSKTPKQLFKIGEKPLICYTLDVFERCNSIDNIVLVAHKKYIWQFRSLIKKYKKIEQICLGGATRQQSVFNGLKTINSCDYVIIHDGVRPSVSSRILSEIVRAVKKYDAVSCAVGAVDTIVEADKGFVNAFLKRDILWRIQTPQAFKFDLILRAHKRAQGKGILNASDDAQLIFGLKKKVKLIAGSYKNIKVTTTSDLLWLKRSKNMPK